MNYKQYAAVEISQLQKKTVQQLRYSYMKRTHFISTSSTYLSRIEYEEKMCNMDDEISI